MMLSREVDMTHARGEREPLASGLTLRRHGECVESVSSNALDICLLASGDGSELLECQLLAGQFITLVPSGEAVETYYLLAGSLRLEDGDQTRVLGVGDTLQTEGLGQPVVLSALSTARFLCFTSRPIFHEMSRDLAELMELAQEIELKDGYTADHCERIRELSNAVGLVLNLPSERRHLLNYAAYLHDVGKTRLPLELLRKPEPLSDLEWFEMKRHPTYGRELLSATFMRAVGPIVEQHHERFDGSGYPLGLSGEEISKEARVIAVVDSYDALTSDRPYRAAVTPEAALAELKRQAGRLFDPEVVAAFQKVLEVGLLKAF